MTDFTDQVLTQCGYAIGAGAKMKVRLDALGELRDFLQPKFKAILDRPKDPKNPDDPGPGAPRWQKFDNFILGCCETIGRLAATHAIARGSLMIEKQDLKPAYNKVSHTNAGGTPGDFCPDWP
jgi:hypothetical protein